MFNKKIWIVIDVTYFVMIMLCFLGGFGFGMLNKKVKNTNEDFLYSSGCFRCVDPDGCWFYMSGPYGNKEYFVEHKCE